MKPLTTLNVAAAGVIFLGAFSAIATDRPVQQCLKLSPEPGPAASMTSCTALVNAGTGETLTGTMAYVLAYIEETDVRGGTAFNPNLKQVSIFATNNGLYIVRVLDLLPGLGLHGPF